MRIALVLGLLVSVAYASDMPPSLHVTATATSSLDKYPPWMAIDGNLGNSTAWCPNKGNGVGEAITYTFDAPVAIAALDIVSGLSPDPNRLGIAPLPDKVEIKTDAQTVMADLKEYTFNKVALSGSQYAA